MEPGARGSIIRLERDCPGGPMNVFISYASEQQPDAEDIALALRGEGHEAFLDRSGLPEGEAYHERIREAVRASDLFVFLISPESVSAGRYTLTELRLAEERWPAPAGHVLPVLVRPTDRAKIPAYLRAVTLLQPSGNAAAEVAAAAGRISGTKWPPRVRRAAIAFFVLAVPCVAAGAWLGYGRWRACDEARSKVREAELQKGGGDYAGAWRAYGDALTSCPGSEEAEVGRERLAMDWLDNIRVTEGKGTFTDIVNQVQSTLARGAVSSSPRRAANALAHLGWGDFLRERDGAGGLDPARYYGQSIQRDPKNAFAHAMWGHNILWKRGELAEARRHFLEAVASGEERTYVRRMELFAYFLYHDPAMEEEALRVVNEMRGEGDRLEQGPTDTNLASKLWGLYQWRLTRDEGAADFLGALPPRDHLATFQWLFPEGTVSEARRPAYLYLRGRLLESAADRSGALASYEALLALLGADASQHSLARPASQAIKRLRAG